MCVCIVSLVSRALMLLSLAVWKPGDARGRMGKWLILKRQTGHLCHLAGSCIRRTDNWSSYCSVFWKVKYHALSAEEKFKQDYQFEVCLYTVLITCAVGSLHSKYTNVKCQYDRNIIMFFFTKVIYVSSQLIVKLFIKNSISAVIHVVQLTHDLFLVDHCVGSSLACSRVSLEMNWVRII